MDDPWNLATWGKQDKEEQHKNTTQYVLDTTIHNNVNKTWALLQTPGGKDEPDITTRNSERKDT
jgi:hypothetical protein